METVKLKKEFLILGVIIAALTVYLFQRSGDRTRYTLPEVPALAASDITKIEIGHAGQSVVLVRRDGRWLIAPPGWTAAPKSVQEMVEALSGLTLTALVAESQNYSLYELDDEHKIHVRAWQDDRLRRELDIGDVRLRVPVLVDEVLDCLSVAHVCAHHGLFEVFRLHLLPAVLSHLLVGLDPLEPALVFILNHGRSLEGFSRNSRFPGLPRGRGLFIG